MTNPAYRVIVNDGQLIKKVFIFTSSTSWTVPLDWNNGLNWIEGIGGGGGGGATGGGGGGAYTLAGNVVLTPGATIPIVIGAGGTSDINGGNTSFNTNTLVARGGQSGNQGGLGGQASLCVPVITAKNGGNGGVGSTTLGPVFLSYGIGGGGGGAAGPNFAGLQGANGNIFIGAGGGGGAGGSNSTQGQLGTYTNGARFGGNGGSGPLGIGQGNGNIATAQSAIVGGGGGGAGLGNISVIYSVGLGGASNSPGKTTNVTVLGFTITAQGGLNQNGGTATTSVVGSARTNQGGTGGNADIGGPFYECGGGGGINASAGFSTGTGGQSIDFQGLRTVVEALGYSWTGPGIQPAGTGTNATGFGCGGGGGYYNFTGVGVATGAAGGAGKFGGGGGGGGNGLLAGPGGNGAVVIQTVSSTTTTNMLFEGDGVYTPPVNLVRLKIWAIGGGAGGRTSSGAQPGGGAGGIAYMEIQGGYNGNSGGQGGNGTVTANGWSSNMLFYGPGGGGGGASQLGIVTDIVGTNGVAGAGGLYGGGSGGGGGTYVAGAPGLLVITYQPFVQENTTIDVDDLLVLKSAVIPSNLSSVGSNSNGQLGLNQSSATLASISSPQQLTGNNQWMNFSAGYLNSAAVNSGGNLFVWGSNNRGQLGLNLSLATNISSPASLGSYWKQAVWGGASTNTFLLALGGDANIYASGSNDTYGLGTGTLVNQSSLVPISRNNKNWKHISATFSSGLAIDNNSNMWAWGDQSIAWSSATGGVSTPVQLGSDTWQYVQGGYNHVMALRSDSTLYAWGFNTQGQLGLGDNIQRLTPVQVGLPGGWKSVACGEFFTLAIASNGSLWAWGLNSSGQLGLGDTLNRSSPTQIGTLTNWQYVACGQASSLAIKSDGTLWTWGANTQGILGLAVNPSVTAAYSSPTQVGSNINWKTASMGQYHMLAGAYPYL